MPGTLLDIVQAAAAELSIPVPVAAIGDTSQNTQQLVALANACGRELSSSYNWTGLVREARITAQVLTLTGTITAGSITVTGLSSTTGLSADWMVSGEGLLVDTRIATVDSPSQVTLDVPATANETGPLRFSRLRYALPADYARLVSRTQWDRTNRWEVIGPATAQNWQWFKAGRIATGPRLRWRIIRNAFEVFPASDNGDILTFEYMSGSWVNDGTTPRTKFTKDTETSIYPDALMICMLKSKYLVAKGLDAQVAMMEYQRQLDLARSQDEAAPNLRMHGQGEDFLLSFDNIPDAGYGL